MRKVRQTPFAAWSSLVKHRESYLKSTPLPRLRPEPFAVNVLRLLEDIHGLVR